MPPKARARKTKAKAEAAKPATGSRESADAAQLDPDQQAISDLCDALWVVYRESEDFINVVYCFIKNGRQWDRRTRKAVKHWHRAKQKALQKIAPIAHLFDDPRLPPGQRWSAALAADLHGLWHDYGVLVVLPPAHAPKPVILWPAEAEFREFEQRVRDRLTTLLGYIDRLEGFVSLPRPSDDSRRSATMHSADFTSINWFGRRYEFNKTQAKCIELLWAEWEKGGLGLSEKTIRGEIGSENDNYRLVHTFRIKSGGQHPAWGTMIRTAGQGIFRLCAPNHS